MMGMFLTSTKTRSRASNFLFLRTASALAVVLLMCSGAAASPFNDKDQNIVQRLDAFEKSINAREKALEDDRRQLEQFKAQMAGYVPSQLEFVPEKNSPIEGAEPNKADTEAGICRLAHKDDFDLAFANPNSFMDCDFGEQVDQARQAASIQNKKFNNYSGISGRVNQALGFRGAVDFSGGDEASVSYSHGIKGRKIGKNLEYQRPILKKITGTISTPINKGKNRLIDFNNGFDVTSGTSFKLAFDYQAFEKEEKIEVFKRTVKFLTSAHEACKKSKKPAINSPAWQQRRDFVSQYTDQDVHKILGVGKPWTENCSEADLINWIFRTAGADGQETLVNQKLAGEYLDLFWTAADEEPVPQLGWGVSVEYASKDFNYLQGTFPIGAEGNRSFDRTVALINDPLTGNAFQQSTDNWVLEGYGSAFRKLYGDKRPKIGIYPEGIMGIASIKYTSSYDFPLDAKGITVCNVEDPAIILADCNSLNVDRPRKQSSFSAGIEGRLVFRNLPVVDLVGFAPKFEYRLDDGLKSLDVPLYVSASDKGIGTSGIRLQGNWGGRDLLGGPRKKDWGLSLFYSASLDFLVK